MEPTGFQKRMLWAGLTAVSMLALVSVIVLVGWLTIRGIAFLQPILTPIAVAGILAYLLEPVVSWLTRRKISRTLSVLIVFLIFFLVVAGLLIWLIPAGVRQGQEFAANYPQYSEKAKELFVKTIEQAQNLSTLPVFQPSGDGQEPGFLVLHAQETLQGAISWLQARAPEFALATGQFLQRSIGGFLGVFGLVISMILVPVFLFFFLKEGPAIAAHWTEYLPLRASPFKSEVVGLLSEINGYLISFFRGQLLVSLIDGAITAVALLIMGLDFALLIGLMVGVLGLIPYLGIIICWVPAVLIAVAQYGDWLHPLMVTVIFLAVNNLDGIFIAPHIVGESVGLHPMTIIVSVFSWSLVLGGLLGALLAVPLTATLKVVLRRYFWDRPGPGQAAPG